jgi:HEPN domain-containing protein
MNESEFLRRMEQVDQELVQNRVPIHARTFRAFRLLAPDYAGPLIGYSVRSEEYPEFVGPNLLDKIDDWYRERYGVRACMPWVVGRVPIILRREIYLIRIPRAYGEPEVKILPLIEGLTLGLTQSLTPYERDCIRNIFTMGWALVYEIDDLEQFLRGPLAHAAVSAEAVQMAQTAKEDRDTMMRCLSGQLDTNNSCFHAQQHAEKMLKAFLLAKTVYTAEQLRRKQLGHNLGAIFEACVQSSTIFLDIITDVGLLNNITMDIRYLTPRVSPEIAVETFWASTRIGGLCASQISGFKRRYNNLSC